MKQIKRVLRPKTQKAKTLKGCGHLCDIPSRKCCACKGRPKEEYCVKCEVTNKDKPSRSASGSPVKENTTQDESGSPRPSPRNENSQNGNNQSGNTSPRKSGSAQNVTVQNVTVQNGNAQIGNTQNGNASPRQNGLISPVHPTNINKEKSLILGVSRSNENLKKVSEFNKSA
eukprot:Phypoly_transcript_14825.p1 GENE.Phypoly_transcript_14825~~Phypoly_transcript_14825.p1  ORF type:complete len:172 (+),score=31.90 Phypoly_transcript_14825:124-639(+)